MVSCKCGTDVLHVGLQEQVARQAEAIEELNEAMASQLDELETTQAQLEATQSSLIDLESHLTSLEEDGEEEPTGRPRSAGTRPKSQQGFSARPGSPTQQLSKEDEDAVASAVVSAFDDLFPASQGSGGNGNAGGAGPPEDTSELFQKAKASLEGRRPGSPGRPPCHKSSAFSRSK